MTSLMQQALGADWDALPLALKAHYGSGRVRDVGHLDIAYPGFMQGYLSLLSLFGALVNRAGQQLPTIVDKQIEGRRQSWRRTITYPDGRIRRFNSHWIHAGGNRLIEFVNPVLGLEMVVAVRDGVLRYQGRRFVAKLGPWLLTIPENWVLGHTTIVETAIDDVRFRMDFRLTHPLFGEVFRYAGVFEARSEATTR